MMSHLKICKKSRENRMANIIPHRVADITEKGRWGKVMLSHA